MLLMMLKKYADKIVFAIFVLQITLIYKLIQVYFPTGHVFNMPFIDNNVPFLSVFAVPYLLYVAVLILPFAMTFKNKKHMLALSSSFLFSSLVCNIFYVLFPIIVIMPEILTSTIFNRLVLFIYSIDGVTNCFPSEHVTFSILSNLCMVNIRKKIAYYMIPATALVVIATLFIKQHYVPDVLAGMVLAFLSFLVFKKIMQKIAKISF